MTQITLKPQQEMGNKDANKFLESDTKFRCEKISKTKHREYRNELLTSTLEASTDNRGDKLPTIGSILPNTALVENQIKRKP